MWPALADKALAGSVVSRDEARAVLHAPPDEVLGLLDAAFRVRRAHWGLRVSLHVLENAKLGACPEDCGFCSQSQKHAGDSARTSPSGEAPIKSVDELVAGARRAHAARAKRYCMVTATRGPSQRDLDTICAAATQRPSAPPSATRRSAPARSADDHASVSANATTSGASMIHA